MKATWNNPAPSELYCDSSESLGTGVPSSGSAPGITGVVISLIEIWFTLFRRLSIETRKTDNSIRRIWSSPYIAEALHIYPIEPRYRSWSKPTALVAIQPLRPQRSLNVPTSIEPLASRQSQSRRRPHAQSEILSACSFFASNDASSIL
jgi:hypothetical protein